MNVLIVAPDNDLAYVDNEVDAVIDTFQDGGHIVVPLRGRVTSHSVLSALSIPRDILWFACHGNNTGVMLSDGEMLTTSRLTQDVRNAGAHLLVLNTCDSELTGYRVHRELGIDVICTVLEVPDIDAYRTGTYLARSLAVGKSVHDAYEQAKPGQNRTYLYLSAYRDHMEKTPEDVGTLLRQMAREISDVREQVGVMHSQLQEVRAAQKNVPPGVSALFGVSFLALVLSLISLTSMLYHM